MRSTLPVAVLSLLVGALLACDGAVDTGGIQTNGVQIGSEGLLGRCDIESVGPDERIDGMSGTPAQLVAALFMPWDATLNAGTEVYGGSFSPEAVGFSKLTGEDSDCVGVWVDTTAQLRVEPGLTAELEGNMRIKTTGEADFALWSEVWAGDIQPSGLDPTALEIARVRFTGAMSSTRLVGSAEFVGCDTESCESEPIGAFVATPSPPP